jgi:hypothetical protein
MITLNGTTGITSTGGYSGDGIIFADGTPSNTLVTDTSGNVGVGTASPVQKLDVQNVGASVPAIRAYGNDQSNNRIRLQNVGSGGLTWDIVGGVNGVGNGFFSIYDATSAATRMAIDSSGNLLVGTTSANGVGWTASPSGAGQIRSSGTGSQDKIQFANSNGVVGAITTNGSSTSYFTSSDYRLKEGIAPMVGALATVTALKPVTYKWKIDGSDGQGFIAHELQEVVPDCVIGTKDGVDAEGNPQYQGIDTSFLVATLTAALQELKAIVDAQGAEIAALKGTPNV